MTRDAGRALIAGLLLLAGPSLAQDGGHVHGSHGGSHGDGQVGSVSFQNSCSPAVQDGLARGVAMLHSFWYSAGERTFREVLATDPGCAIATWGVASLLMSNPLAGTGSTPEAAQAAQAAIAQGRAIANDPP